MTKMALRLVNAVASLSCRPIGDKQVVTFAGMGPPVMLICTPTPHLLSHRLSVSVQYDLLSTKKTSRRETDGVIGTFQAVKRTYYLPTLRVDVPGPGVWAGLI
ncbi:unnamed protein product [Protopolystoma xenopodis]|uniref:Uncharacterized protein n=1 Tax=Protopolystoma xenopodis TaxID=117903 RepID=A0A448XNV7_9PLAT|nr:unnamed protein product [Protopolystoma xenopodis]